MLPQVPVGKCPLEDPQPTVAQGQKTTRVFATWPKPLSFHSLFTLVYGHGLAIVVAFTSTSHIHHSHLAIVRNETLQRNRLRRQCIPTGITLLRLQPRCTGTVLVQYTELSVLPFLRANRASFSVVSRTTHNLRRESPYFQDDEIR